MLAATASELLHALLLITAVRAAWHARCVIAYDGLQDREPELLKAGAERLARTAEWFPKTSEWRAAAETIRRERIEAQQEYLRWAPRPLYRVCDDTGWESAIVIERGQSVRRVAPCPCREQRRRERLGRVPMPALPPATEAPDLGGLREGARDGQAVGGSLDRAMARWRANAPAREDDQGRKTHESVEGERQEV
jgi:hypothetical protein